MTQIRSLLKRTFSTAIFLLVGTILTTLFSLSTGMRWLMPLLGAASIYPLYIVLIRKR